MTWTIANAKQQFSEVVRLCAEKPQAVYNRSRPVAVLVSAEDYQAFETWQRERQSPAAIDVAGLFADARLALEELGLEGLDLPARQDRPGADFGPVEGESTAAPDGPDHATQ
jgi:prevent-host-death family protein